jgi:ABC-2 type transport system ATP-binding protein
MIELIDLTKRYGNTAAVNSLNLHIPSGEIFGFLGPNGAGKTTTIRMMMGLLQPTSGRILLGGADLAVDPLAAKAICGFVPDRPHVYEKLTGAEYLDFAAQLYSLPETIRRVRRDRFLEVFDLGDWADELIEGYSHGMKQRLVMASALMHEPKLLIVDEPTVGMDPRGSRLLKRIFRETAARSATVFMSTHSLDVAEELCDRVGIILQGNLIALGTVEELRAKADSHADSTLESIFLRLTGGEEEASFEALLS